MDASGRASVMWVFQSVPFTGRDNPGHLSGTVGGMWPFVLTVLPIPGANKKEHSTVFLGKKWPRKDTVAFASHREESRHWNEKRVICSCHQKIAMSQRVSLHDQAENLWLAVVMPLGRGWQVGRIRLLCSPDACQATPPALRVHSWAAKGPGTPAFFQPATGRCACVFIPRAVIPSL